MQLVGLFPTFRAFRRVRVPAVVQGSPHALVALMAGSRGTQLEKRRQALRAAETRNMNEDVWIGERQFCKTRR
jgi:hypothetical protein